MQIQPITNQPNFNGKFVFKERAEKFNKYAPSQISKLFNDVTALVSEKPYDIFIWTNKNNPEFYNVAATKTFENAQKIKEYTVKVHSNSILESMTEAVKDAIEMYEKYISKNIK